MSHDSLAMDKMRGAELYLTYSAKLRAYQKPAQPAPTTTGESDSSHTKASFECRRKIVRQIAATQVADVDK
jgi:hypothetical protein